MKLAIVRRWSAVYLVIVAVCLSTAFVTAPSGATIQDGNQVTKNPFVASSSSIAKAKLPTLAAAGDISPDKIADQRATSNLVLNMDPTRVLTLGDHQYAEGTYAEFRKFYDPTWGRFINRTLPAPGNHEYRTRNAAGYFRYFGKRARPDGRSYYSTALPGWRIISLNSNIRRGPKSRQVKWLKAELKQNRRRCVLAFWHHPRFSSGADSRGDTRGDAFTGALYRARADLVLSGHVHNYERFGLQSPAGGHDLKGVRQFVVGTGGNGHYGFHKPEPHSQKRITGRYGVLHLLLQKAAYRWKFVAVGGKVLDRGGPRKCH